MGEQQNILSGLVQTGTVTAIDSAKRKARVKFKDTGIISGWLYVLQHYGADFTFEPDAKHTHEITDTFTGGGVGRRIPCARSSARLAPDLLDAEGERSRPLPVSADIQRGRYCVRRVLIMGMVGCLGDIVFTVSDRTIKTIDNVTWSGSARYATHQRHGTHALTEFTGLDPDKMSFDIVLSAYLGVDPITEVVKLWKL